MPLIHGRDTTGKTNKPLKVTANGQIEIALLSGEDQTNNVLVVEQGQYGYEVVTDDAGGDKALGATGGTGDFLHSLVFPQTTATGSVVLKDDTTTIMTFPAGTAPGVFEINAVSQNGAWKLNNLGDVDVIAVGRFT